MRNLVKWFWMSEVVGFVFIAYSTLWFVFDFTLGLYDVASIKSVIILWGCTMAFLAITGGWSFYKDFFTQRED